MSKENRTTALVEDETLIYQRDGEYHRLQVGTPAWYAWLQTATLFRVRVASGTFTVRREQAGNQRGNWYWRAYLKRNGKLHRVYLGMAQEVTPERLKAIAARFFASSLPASEKIESPSNALQSQPDSHKQAQDTTKQPGTVTETPASFQRATPTLPLPLTSFIGREQEITATCTLLLLPEVRILTLTGTGGVGKTRLALAIATEVQENFPDGVSFISLAPIRNADLVLAAIVQALGLQEKKRLPLEVLQAEIREQRRLLMLDNFEQVVEAAPLLLDLLAACPGLKLLVTSREALHVRGEREFVVQPLTLPDSVLPDAQMIFHYGAVALFLERAREALPTLELNALTAPMIIEICRRLDGLPLALELAVARLKVLPLQTLLERLEHRLYLLTNGPRDLPNRQQTLRQTIAWSYDLLSHEEQCLFRLLSVFSNGCTLEAAEAVYNMSGGERAQVLDLVTSLLNKHLLYQSQQGDHTPRLLLHETIREYGLEALAATHELEAARQVHAEYYLGLTEAHLKGTELAIWLDQLECEYANLRAALQWVLEKPASKIALRLESALFHFWGRHLRQDVSAQAQTGTRLTTESQALAQDKPGQWTAPGLEVVTPQSERGNAPRLARSLYLLGLIAWIIGDFALARMYTEEGLVKARDQDEKITLAYMVDLSGQIALDQGEDIQARTLLEEGLRLHREAGDTLGGLNALFFLERLLITQGERIQARAYAEEHLTLSKTLGFHSGVISTLTFLGRLTLEEGNAARAHKLFEESLTLLHETNENSPLSIASTLQEIGVTLATQGRLIEAVRLWGAARSLCALLPEERAFVARASAAVRAELGEEAFSRAWAEGQAMSTEQALAAIEHVAHSSQPPAQATSDNRKARHPLPSSYDLTAREEEVLRLVARGLTDAQIAESLVISPRTVNAHLRSIYAKLDITSRHAATYFALQHGLI